jgi:hypothetical protein
MLRRLGYCIGVSVILLITGLCPTPSLGLRVSQGRPSGLRIDFIHKSRNWRPSYQIDGGIALILVFGDVDSASKGGLPLNIAGFVCHHSSSYVNSLGATLPEEFIGHVPYWFLVAIGLACAYHLSVKRARRAARTSLACRHCGYDLRAHHPGDKCHECGARIPTPPPAPPPGP